MIKEINNDDDTPQHEKVSNGRDKREDENEEDSFRQY